MNAHALLDPVSKLSDESQQSLFPKEETLDSIIKTLPHLSPGALLDVWQFVRFQEYKTLLLKDKPTEDEQLWAAVQREYKYREAHPEDVIICNSLEDIDAALGMDEE